MPVLRGLYSLCNLEPHLPWQRPLRLSHRVPGAIWGLALEPV